MKRKKVLLAGLCVLFMMFGILTSASAYIVPDDALNTWTQGVPPKNLDAGDIASVVGYTGTGNLALVELYKQNTGAPLPADTGSFAASYITMYGAGNESATIKWVVSTPHITADPLYLYVKDGNNNPSGYIFDISNWDGTSDLVINQLWEGTGSISHVALYAPNSTVPLPAAAWLLGSGLIGLVSIRRRKTK